MENQDQEAEKRRSTRKVKGKSREWKKRNSLVSAALDNGWTTYSKISKNTGLTIAIVGGVFKQFPDTHSKFCVARRTIVDMAADNINDMVSDQSHINNFAASKYVLSKYKSDLDVNLESHEQDELKIEGTDGGSAVTIVFSKKEDK